MHYKALLLASAASVAFGQSSSSYVAQSSDTYVAATTSAAPAPSSTFVPVVSSDAPAAPASTSAFGTCAAQNILDACKLSIQGQINACAGNDYTCLCDQYINMLTCYNNCPQDSSVTTVQSQKDQYCNYASAHPSSSSTTNSTRTSHSSTSLTSSSATSTSTDDSDDGESAASRHVSNGLMALVIAGLGMLL